jgi:TRAP transporter 4TM/12TM fusion protein
MTSEVLEEAGANWRADRLVPWQARLFTALAIAWSVFQVYTGLFGLYPAVIQRSTTVLFAFLLTFLGYGFTRKSPKDKVPLPDVALMVLTLVCVIYLWTQFKVMVFRGGAPNTTDVVLGLILTALTLDVTRRAVGLPLTVVSSFFLVYGYFGPYFPGLLGHRGYSLQRIGAHMFMGLEGIFSIPISVMTSFVFAFILFGSFLEVTGGARLFINLAYALAGRRPGGPAKTAVIASAMMGTISGSSLANVVTTGNFTIPLMKKVGYRPSFAGGVEAAASSGGQLMPPVMGAAAFIMAEMTGIPYLQICIAAAIPAVLYFFAVFVMVHLEARRLGLKGSPEKDLPRVKDALLKSFPLLVPVAAIIYLLVSGYTPLKAAYYATGIMILTSSFSRETRLTPWKFLRCLEKSAINSIAVTAACAACGIIIGIITLTGLGLKMAQFILMVSGGHLFLTLLLTMVASIVLGMGLPTTAKYIVLATIAAPALTMIGVPLIAAHLFILYYGIVAEVTPPVALTSFAGAAVAKAPGIETAFVGLRLSFAGFLLPFLFVYSPELLLIEGTAFKLILAIGSAIVGIISLGAALGGHFIIHCRWYERLVLLASSLLLLTVGWKADLIGLLILMSVVALQKVRERGVANPA